MFSQGESDERTRTTLLDWSHLAWLADLAMSNIFLLAVCLVAGALLRGTGRLAADGHAALNAVIINVALPALTLSQVKLLQPDLKLLLPIALPWFMFLLSVGFFHLVGRSLRLAPATSGALMLCGGLANTSFVGLPMIQAFYGADGLPVGLLMDQLGTYLVLNTLGLAVASLHMPMKDKGGSAWQAAGRTMRRIVTFPPFVALVFGLCTLPFGMPDWLHDVLSRLGALVVPLALVSIGAQLRVTGLRGVARPLAAGLAFKLVLAPLVLTLLVAGMLNQGGPTTQVALFETAMGPQIGASIVALQYGLDARVIAAMVGVGSLLSFVTLPAWWVVLGYAVA